MEGVPLLDTYSWSFDTSCKIYCQLGSFIYVRSITVEESRVNIKNKKRALLKV